MFSADKTEYYNDFYPDYNTNSMQPTTSQPRLSLDSGLGLTNDSFYSSDFNESQLVDISAASASESSFSLQSGPLEFSPPTKWARIRTPPSRKKSLIGINKSDPAFGISLFSPPSRKKKKRDLTSPTPSMRTPESLRQSIRISSPSPFKVTFSKTPLKLSNNENVTGFHIGKTGAYYNKKVTGSASKRCLLTARPDGFTILGSPNSDVFDVPSQNPFDDDGDSHIDSPSKILRSLETGDDGSMDYHQYAGMIESGRCPPPPQPSTSFENFEKINLVRKTASRNLLKSKVQLCEEATHHPLIPMIKQETNDSELTMDFGDSKKKNSAVKRLPIKSKQELKDEKLRNAKEKEMKEWKFTPFQTPIKQVPLYSGRWLVISTGRTLAQQELSADAKRFLRTIPVRPSVQLTSSRIAHRRLPTIARVTLFKHRYQSLRV